MLPIINLGPLSFPTAGLVLIFGFWLGSVLAGSKAKVRSGADEAVDKVLWGALLSGLIGARISFFARHPTAFQGQLVSLFSLNPALLDLSGGLLIALAVSSYLIVKGGYRVLDILDDLVPFFSVLVPALALSRFASGSGYGMVTDLPWGIDLWGASRHPVQLYYLLAGGMVLLIQLRWAKLDSRPGKDILSFVIYTSGYFTLLSAFQAPTGVLLCGFQIQQIVYYLIFSISLIVNLIHYSG